MKAAEAQTSSGTLVRPSLASHLRVIAMAFEMNLRQNMTDAFVLFGIFVQPVIIAILAFWMLQDQSGSYVIFVVIGSGMTGLWTAVLFDSGNSITGERWTGTLESLVATPTPIGIITFGKNLATVFQSLGSMVISFSLAILLFGYVPVITQPALFFVSIVFSMFAYICFGLVMATLFILNPDIRRLQNGMEFPVYILSGFLFPIALLPGWTTPLSYLLAPYWAARALHATSSGTAGLAELALSWGMMLLFSVAYIFIARRLFRVMLRKARVDATLGMQ